MRSISANNLAALQARRLVARDFLWIIARTLSNAVPYAYGFWSDVGNVATQILNPNTGLPETRNFEGSGSIIQIGDIPLVSNLSTQNVTIVLSQIDDAVANIVRGYDMKQAAVEVYRGMFDPLTRQMVDPAYCRFNGYVDDIDIVTPKEGDAGSITLNCAPNTQETTRNNPETRSHDSQTLRSATDDFFRDATTVADWEFFWGRKAGKVDTAGAQRIGSSIQAVNR